MQTLSCRQLLLPVALDWIAVHTHAFEALSEHMPSSHRRFADWTIERIHRDAAEVGASTEMLCKLILESRRHPEKG
jgi:hypothetical protein